MKAGAGSVAVVFVNFHSERLVAPRAARLLHAGFGVVVADNSRTYSGPGSVVHMPVNAGFGAGCNAAIASLGPGSEVAVLHNPDVDASASALLALAERLGEQSRPGLIAPALRVGGVVRPEGFHEPAVPRELGMVLLGRRQPRYATRADVRPAPAVGSDGARHRFGSAALLAVDLRAMRSLRGFDERYFLYVEDCDLWWRARAAGHSVGFAPDVLVDHEGGASSPMPGSDRELLRWVGVELFIALHRPYAWPAFRLVHLPGLIANRGQRSPLRDLVASHWLRANSPVQVAYEVRRLLAGG